MGYGRREGRLSLRLPRFGVADLAASARGRRGLHRVGRRAVPHLGEGEAAARIVGYRMPGDRSEGAGADHRALRARRHEQVLVRDERGGFASLSMKINNDTHL